MIGEVGSGAGEPPAGVRHDCGVPGPVYGIVIPTPSYVKVCVGQGGSATVDVPNHVAVTSWPSYVNVKSVGDASARFSTAAGAAAAKAAKDRTERIDETMMTEDSKRMKLELGLGMENLLGRKEKNIRSRCRL